MGDELEEAPAPLPAAFVHYKVKRMQYTVYNRVCVYIYIYICIYTHVCSIYIQYRVHSIIVHIVYSASYLLSKGAHESSDRLLLAKRETHIIHSVLYIVHSVLCIV